MGDAIVWWITLQVLGLAALPIAAVILRSLPDKGYAISKVLGLLLVGWLGYTLAMMHILPFGRLSLLLCLLVVVGLSAWLLYRNDRAGLREFTAHYRSRSTIVYIVTAELFFAVLYTVWAIFRAFNPEIFAQEKFMDFGFLNSILKSGFFPPNDMWFAGHSINYYYFGYVLMAALTSLSGVETQVAFNLANVALFAMTGLAAFGVVYNLIAVSLLQRANAAHARPARSGVVPSKKKARPATEAAARTADAPMARAAVGAARSSGGSQVAVIEPRPRRKAEPDGNGRGQGEAIPRSRSRDGVSGYESRDLSLYEQVKVPFYLSPYLYAIIGALMVVAMGNLAVGFAKHDGPTTEGNGFRFCFLCPLSESPAAFNWWAPSRIILDYKTTEVPGQAASKAAVGYETINEFPAFSFLLADMHPHVMALPLVLLTITLAYAMARRKVLRGTRWIHGIPRSVESWLALIIAGITVGSLYTTNTWDYPTYLLVTVLALGLPYLAFQRRGERQGKWAWIQPWILQSVLLVVLSLISYVLFHLSFKSLLSGKPVPLPENIANLPVIGWLLEKLSGLLIVNTADKTILGFVVIFGVFLLSIVVWVLYELATTLRKDLGGDPASMRRVYVIGGIVALIWLIAFLLKFPLLALLLPLIVFSAYLLWRDPSRLERNMALILFGVGAIIALVVEVVFLRDNFEMRMNTLFKFYYQIWVLWALAAAFGLWKTLYAVFNRREEVSSRGRVLVGTSPIGAKLAAGLWTGVFAFLVLTGLLYAYYGPMSRQVTANPQFRGLDGQAHFKNSSPGDYDAINWLKQNGGGTDVVLE